MIEVLKRVSGDTNHFLFVFHFSSFALFLYKTNEKYETSEKKFVSKRVEINSISVEAILLVSSRQVME